jgi:hypothetical protein
MEPGRELCGEVAVPVCSCKCRVIHRFGAFSCAGYRHLATCFGKRNQRTMKNRFYREIFYSAYSDVCSALFTVDSVSLFLSSVLYYSRTRFSNLMHFLFSFVFHWLCVDFNYLQIVEIK